jgi:tripartite ATP-independent transporter DctM subunit
MSDLQIAGAGLVVLILLLLARVPIAVALGVISFAGIWLVIGPTSAWGILTAVPYDVVASWSLSSVPMFLLMGYVCYYAKLTDGLFEMARMWLSRLPGGLAVASIGAAAGFSAVTGSSVACAAAIGRIAVPEMLRAGYDKGLAAGVCAAAGTIGSMIPPSILLLLYGLFVEAPIGPLFLAGFLPGILTAFMYGAMVVGRVAVSPMLAPPVDEHPSWRERLLVLSKTGPTILLIVGVFGGLFAGLFTPTEAGAVGALLAILLALARRSLSWKALMDAFEETLVSSSAIFIIAIGANMLTRFLALAGFTDWLGEVVTALELGQTGLLLAVAAVYLFLGCFLDPLGIMLLTLPILLPLVETAQVDLIWFGILVVKLLEIGLITPPVGLNVFVLKGVVGNLMTSEAVFRGVAWFIVADIVTMALLIAFPEISLFLPRLLQ